MSAWRGLAAAFVLLLAAPREATAQPIAGVTRVLVVPFESSNSDPRSVWLGEATAVLIADTLRTLNVPALSRNERIGAFEDLNLPSGGPLSFASLIRVGQLVAASDIVVGTLRLSGDDLILDGRRIRLETGRVEQRVTDRGPLRELFALHERVTRRLFELPPAASARSTAASPPLAAFEGYIKGLLAEQPATKIQYLESALASYPGYDLAQLALWEAVTEQGDHTKALAAVQKVDKSSRFYRLARFRRALSLLEVKRFDDAFTLFKALNDEQPAAALHNNLGIVQLRRSGSSAAGRPVYFFNKAAEMDADDSDYFFNLGYGYWLDKDTQAAIYWLREAVRRNTADADAHMVLGAALHSAGSTAEAARERELARQLSSKYEDLALKPGTGDTALRYLERVSTALDPSPGVRLDAALLETAHRDQSELASFHLDRGRRLFEQERNLEALGELRKAVYLAPYRSEPHLLIGRTYLRTGRPREAADALRVAIWSEETAAARLSLAEALLQLDDRTAARREAARALELDPNSASAKDFLARLDKR